MVRLKRKRVRVRGQVKRIDPQLANIINQIRILASKKSGKKVTYTQASKMLAKSITR